MRKWREGMIYEGWDRFYPMFLYRALEKMKVWEREMIAFYATNPFPEEGVGIMGLAHLF